MTLDDFLNHIEAGGALNTPEIYRLMDEMSDEARRVTCEINNSYHSQEELRAFMSRLTDKPVDETFKMFPPFYTDFGKKLEGVSPLRQLERGYAYVSDEEGHGITSAGQVTKGQLLLLDVRDGRIESEVTAVKKRTS